MSESAESLPELDPLPPPGWGPTVQLACVIGLAGIAMFAWFLPADRRVREAGPRMQCKSNLKHIALALHNYHDVHGHFPPAYTVDSHGNKLHSWRTLILPYLEEIDLYESLDLTKPWDHPVNSQALSQIPACYQCPSTSLESGYTTYLASVGDHRFFGGSKGHRIRDITDGTTNTIAIFEVNKAQAVPWMKPYDLNFAPSLTKPDYPHTGTQVAMGDGSVRFIRLDSLPEALTAMFTRDGGEKIEYP